MKQSKQNQAVEEVKYSIVRPEKPVVRVHRNTVYVLECSTNKTRI